MSKIGDWHLRGAVKYGALPRDLSPELIASAKEVCARMERAYSAWNGEYRRHKAYAALCESHPQASRRAIAIAIELGLPGEGLAG